MGMGSPPRGLVECVPNFSEGRDKAVTDAIAAAVAGVDGVALLGFEPNADANRSVYTFAGAPEAVAAAALAAARVAYDRIDMSRHKGAHPRMGALDVCPFVPVSGIEMAPCVELARFVAGRLAAELGVPVYLYEEAASRPERRSLAYLRSGEYEALPAKLALSEWQPDFGPSSFVARWGASVLGARPFLIAYNVNLNTRDKEQAKKIASRIRESGKGGGAFRRLKALRAIGWYMDSYQCAQVSCNLLDYQVTGLHTVFEAVKEEAEGMGLRVEGSELVGLVPLESILAAGRSALGRKADRPGLGEGELVKEAIDYLGLDSVAPFDPERKVLEYALKLFRCRKK